MLSNLSKPLCGAVQALSLTIQTLAGLSRASWIQHVIVLATYDEKKHAQHGLK